jgi:integrase
MKRNTTKQNAAEVYLSRWSKKSDTYKTMLSALNQVARTLEPGTDATTYPWHKLRYESARSIPAELAELEPATINKLLSAVRGVLEVARDMDLISAEEYTRIRIKNVRGSSEKTGDRLKDDVVERVRNYMESMPPRDAAMVAVMLGTGARRVEVVKISVEDYTVTRVDDGAGGQKEIARLALYGKGRKPRSVPVGPSWRPWIEKYFGTLTRGQLAFPVSRSTVSYVVKCLSATLGAKFTPHDFRRTFGTLVCEKADPAVAQRLLGHSDIKTTMLYDRRGEEAEDDAVKDW